MTKGWPSAVQTVRFAVTRTYSRFRALLGLRHAQLIVCGYPRGGTSLIYNMLSASLSGYRFEPFEVPVIYRIHRLGNIASKFPLDVFNLADVPALNIHDKKLQVIAMLRDPRDLVTSRHPVLPDRYFIGHDHSWWPQDPEFKTWTYDAAGIVAIFNELERLRDEEEIPILFLRFEDLVRDPDAIQRRIADRFDLRFAGRFSTFHERQDKMAYRYEGKRAPRDPSLAREDRPTDSTRSGKWRKDEHRERILSQFEECPALFDILVTYGYEEDERWFSAYRNG